MRLKKWVGTTTATVLVSSLILAGCGGNTKTGGNEGSSPKNTESAAPASKETVTLKAYFPGINRWALTMCYRRSMIN